ncbi:MAG: hypothetical protein WD207_07035 [Xanthobacteraceae bacterium]
MWDFSIGTSFALVLRTLPFMLLRAATYFGIAAAFVVAGGGGAGIGWGIGALAGRSGHLPGAFWGTVAGFACVALMLWWLREYFLYLVKAGHVAAMVFVLDRRNPLAGQGQVGHAVSIVQQRFRQIGVLFAIERLVHGTLATLIGILDLSASLLPAGISVPPAPVNAVLRVALNFLTEVVLARPLRATTNNPWVETRDALILFAQNHAVLMRNAMLLAAFSYCAAFVAFLIALVPAARLAYTFAGGSALIALLLALIFAWCFKQALIDPYVIASMLQVYFRAADGQIPDPAWDAKLTEMSEEFREIRARAFPAQRSPRRL